LAFKRVEVRKKKPGPGWWSEKTKMEVVTSYVLLGKVSLVVATTGIPEDTVRKWKMQPWWKEAEDEIRRSSKLALSGRLQNVVQKTMEALEDRVANGDYIYDSKLQKFVRKPIGALAANKIAGDMIDRAMILEEKGIKEQVTNESIQERLDKLRMDIRGFVKQKGPKANEEDIIDVVPCESVPPALLSDGTTILSSGDGPQQRPVHSLLDSDSEQRVQGSGGPVSVDGSDSSPQSRASPSNV
jgi:hypothetical protein